MWHFSTLKVATTTVLLVLTTSSFASLSIDDTTSISSTATTLASTLLSYIPPNTPSGLLPSPYYWWESGNVWSALLDYWHYTGDAQYNGAATTAIVSNLGATNDFLGPNTLGNDDQGWWAMTAMSAAEYGLPAGPNVPAWLTIAQTVWSEMAGRWDTSTCGGGLKWKLSESADPIGFAYKNSVSNGLFFQLSARLYKLTGSSQYSGMADEIFTWMQSVNLIDKNTWAVYDGTDDRLNCTQVDHDRWSYNVGLLLYGSAVMQAMPNSDPVWSTRTNGLLDATAFFFDGSTNIMQETKCEPSASCDTDQLSFKAYLARYLAASAIVLPELQPRITPLLQSSAGGAVVSCQDGPAGTTCGVKWTLDAWDGTEGAGQQMCALEVVHGLLATGAAETAAPASQKKAPQRNSARLTPAERRWRFSWSHGGSSQPV